MPRRRCNPSAINFRANLYGMKSLGVEWVISVSAVGSMREHIHPGDVVIPDQFFDRTRSRVSTFFDTGVVAHVDFGDAPPDAKNPSGTRPGGVAGGLAKPRVRSFFARLSGREGSCEGLPGRLANPLLMAADRPAWLLTAAQRRSPRR